MNITLEGKGGSRPLLEEGEGEVPRVLGPAEQGGRSRLGAKEAQPAPLAGAAAGHGIRVALCRDETPPQEARHGELLVMRSPSFFLGVGRSRLGFVGRPSATRLVVESGCLVNEPDLGGRR